MSEHKAREAKEAREQERRRERAAFVATLAAILESGDRAACAHPQATGYATNLPAAREYVARGRELAAEAEVAEGL